MDKIELKAPRSLEEISKEYLAACQAVGDKRRGAARLLAEVQNIESSVMPALDSEWQAASELAAKAQAEKPKAEAETQ